MGIAWHFVTKSSQVHALENNSERSVELSDSAAPAAAPPLALLLLLLALLLLLLALLLLLLALLLLLLALLLLLLALLPPPLALSLNASSKK